MPSNCGLEERTATLGSYDASTLQVGSFWELVGEAAKSGKLESPSGGPENLTPGIVGGILGKWDLRD